MLRRNGEYDYPKLEKTLEEPGVIAFADWELGPHEVHLVARYVTTSVVTHFNNFETRGELGMTYKEIAWF